MDKRPGFYDPSDRARARRLRWGCLTGLVISLLLWALLIVIVWRTLD